MPHDHRISWGSLIVAGAVLGTAFWVLIFLLQGVPFELFAPALLRFGFVSAAMLLAWHLLAHRLWRRRLIRAVLRVKLPDLNGRWVGNYTSSYDRVSRSMALEISQSMLNLHCMAYSDEVRAESFTARLLSDPDGHTFQLAYLYHAQHPQHTAMPGDEHQGAVLLDLKPGSPRRLSGSYFNDRKPEQLRGQIALSYDGPGLKGAL